MKLLYVQITEKSKRNTIVQITYGIIKILYLGGSKNNIDEDNRLNVTRNN